jgi:hypothetical protein
LHAVPREDSIYVGATNWLSNTPQSAANVNDLHFLLGCAMKQLHTNLSTGQIAGIQVGNRPVPVDGFPLIGALPETSWWMLTGTYRDGFHQSPLLASYMAEAISERGSDKLPAVFNPVRAPIEASTREQVVSQTVNHTLATGFESDWQMPVVLSGRLKGDLTRSTHSWRINCMRSSRLHPKSWRSPRRIPGCDPSSKLITHRTHESVTGNLRSSSDLRQWR